MWGEWRDPKDDGFRDLLLKGLVEKGGKGSGHRGHKGRPGIRGGSAPRGAAPKPGEEAKPGEGPPPLEAEVPEWLLNGEVTDIKENPGGVNGEATFRGKIGEHQVFMKAYDFLNPRVMRNGVAPKLDLEHEMAAQIMNNALEKPTNFPLGVVRETAKGRTWVQMFAGVSDVHGGGKHFGDFSQEQKDGMGLLDAVIGNLDRHEKNMRFEGQTLFAIDHGLAFPEKNVDQWANQVAARNRSQKLSPDDSRRLDNIVIRRGEIDGALSKWLKPPQMHAMWQRIDYMRRNKEVVVPGQWKPPASERPPEPRAGFRTAGGRPWTMRNLAAEFDLGRDIVGEDVKRDRMLSDSIFKGGSGSGNFGHS